MAETHADTIKTNGPNDWSDPRDLAPVHPIRQHVELFQTIQFELENLVDIEAKKKRISELRAEALQLEQELSSEPSTWHPAESHYYGMYHATSGLVLGSVGAVASLLFNVVGSLAIGQHPLELIRVYLTFPLGEKAFEVETGMTLAIGCCLYIGTGMLFGIVFQMMIARIAPNGSLMTRLGLATVLGVTLWLVNFYLILDWLQPLLIGGNWIVDPDILPPWVGVATHLVFAWTMACLFPYGKHEPYRRQTRKLTVA